MENLVIWARSEKEGSAFEFCIWEYWIIGRLEYRETISGCEVLQESSLLNALIRYQAVLPASHYSSTP